MGINDYPPIELSQHFNVPAENIFNAWTDSAIIRKWMFRGENNDIVQVINNLEKNGAFSVIRQAKDGEWMDHYGTYRELSRPTLLSFSLESPELFQGISNVTVRIVPTENGSTMSFLQTGVDPVVFTSVWREMFDRLEKIMV